MSPRNHPAVKRINRSLSALKTITQLKDVGRKKPQQWEPVHQGAVRHWKVAGGMRLCETRNERTSAGFCTVSRMFCGFHVLEWDFL